MKLEAGKHLCKIVSYGMQIDEKKSDFVWVEFEDPEQKSITWYGYLSEKAAPYTVEALQKTFNMMGDACECLERIGSEGIDSHLLNTDKEYEVVVEDEIFEGKTRAKVKYVNEPGVSKKFGKIAAEKLKGRFNHLNLPKTKEGNIPF